VVLARKWRPAQFADIVGQTPVVRTLMNAIHTNRIHQAYLFTGSRGIGKTSIARIIAKAVRCPDVKWDGTWLRCCDQCSSCTEIAHGNSVDVIEIDGASNNGVDHVREIRENAKFLPSAGSRKVYIIDEVHMLSTAAFNALLKTLEEPPAHVLFIMATTEPHKIPATILSRCQRFDLKRVSQVQIQERLVEVLKAEGLDAEPGALALVARAAEGGLRDALSLLDQVIAFSGKTVSVQSVRESIGLIESHLVTAILKEVLARNPLAALESVQAAYRQGHDLKLLTRHLIEFLHGVILAKVGAPAQAAGEFSESEWQELQQLATLRELEELELIFQALHHGIEWIARSPQPKLVLDVLLIKCASAEALMSTDGGVAGPSASGAGTGSPSAGPGAARSSAAPTTGGPIRSAAPAPAQAATASLNAAPTPSQAPALNAAPTSKLQETAALAPAPTEAATPKHQSTSPATPAPAAAPAPAKTFEGFIQHIRQNRPFLASVMEHLHPEALPSAQENKLHLVCIPSEAFYREQLQNKQNLEPLLQFVREYFSATTQIRIEVAAEDNPLAKKETIAARKEREAREHEERARDAAANHPVIREAQALFGGELSPIEVIPADGERSGHAR
jgi:DNA polymerase-3 subunit gamma/tau